MPSARPEASRRSLAEVGSLPITLLVQAASSAATLAPAVAAPGLLAALDASAVVVGVYIAIVYFGAMVSSQWGAALVRRWGPIRCSQASLAASAIGLALVAVPVPAWAALGALLVGFGYGPITPASSEILARSTPPERYALVFSVKQTGVPLGGAVAGLLVPPVLQSGGPRAALLAVAGLCVLGMVLAQALRRGLDAHRDPTSPRPTLRGMTEPLRFVLGHATLRPLALCSMVFSAVQVCLTSYAVSWLTGDLAWSLVAAGAALSAAQVVASLGRVLWGLLADRLRNARAVLVGLALAMTACGLAAAAFGPGTDRTLVTALLLVYGASAIGWNGVYLATVARLVPMERATQATSGSLFFTYFGVVIGPPLFGLAAGAFGRIGPSFALLALPMAWTLWSLMRSRWSSH